MLKPEKAQIRISHKLWFELWQDKLSDECRPADTLGQRIARVVEYSRSLPPIQLSRKHTPFPREPHGRIVVVTRDVRDELLRLKDPNEAIGDCLGRLWEQYKRPDKPTIDEVFSILVKMGILRGEYSRLNGEQVVENTLPA